MVGDILVTFNPTSQPWPARSKHFWKQVQKFYSAKVWTTEPDEAWHGFPAAMYKDEIWAIWALGKFDSPQPTWPASLNKPNSLNGHFLIFAHQKQLRQWHVFTNRLGTMHAYLSTQSGRTALSTFSHASASASGDTTMDWSAVGGFLRFGFFLGDNTYRENTKLIPPATHLIMDEEGKIIYKNRYWQWSYQPDQAMGADAAVEEFSEIFKDVLLEMVSDKNLALPLSGGLDSRSTLAELGRPDMAGAKSLFPFSYGYTDNSVETKIARQLAKKRNLSVKTWTIQPYLFQKLDQVLASVEGFQDITLCRQAYVVGDLAQNADNVLAAHWGDVWLDSMGFVGQKLPNKVELSQEIMHKFQKKGSEELIALFHGFLPAQLNEIMQTEIEKSLGCMGDISEKDFLIKAWKTSQWSHRWTLASIRMYQAGVFPLLPFYNNRLVDFFTRIPSEFMIGRNLQIKYIKRVAPDLAKVNWQPYDANLYNYKYFDSWSLPRRFLKKAARKILNQKVIQRNWEVQFLNPRGKQGLYQWLLSGGLRLHDFVAAAHLEKLLTSFYENPTASNGYTVSMLLTLSAWLESQK